jgi:transcriptional regulator with XRE-family HTH domain
MSDNLESVDEATVNVAQRIRILRERRNLSQRALAEASGLSRNTLGLLERGQSSPTVSTLMRIALALGVDINAFFATSEHVNVVHVTRARRPELQLRDVSMADLGVGMLDQMVTPLVLRLGSEARSGPPISHEGQDFVFCMSGEVLYTVSGQAFLLEPGDSLFYDGHLPHRFQNAGSQAAEVLIVLSAPHDSATYVANHFPQESGVDV